MKLHNGCSMKIFRMFALTAIVTLLPFSSFSKNVPPEIAAICGANGCDRVFKDMRRLAKNGSPQAQAIVALLAREGYGTEKDYKLSVRYMKYAARNGLSPAMFDLARIYREGKIIEKDIEESNYWLLRAAKKGHAKALAIAIDFKLLSSEEGSNYGAVVPKLARGEQVLTIRAGSVTLTELSEHLKRSGFNQSSQTGTRLRGKGCLNSSTTCRSTKITPLLKQDLHEMLSNYTTW